MDHSPRQPTKLTDEQRSQLAAMLEQQQPADVVNNVFFEKFYKIKLHVSQFMKRINKQPMETIDRLLVKL